MKVTRNTDLRKVHHRPDNWWARINWDYEHMTQEERIAKGRRNLSAFLVFLFIMFVTAFTAWLAVVSGSVALAILTVVYIFGRGRSR